ncbi:MAG: ethanolamine utilization microcompartment protein EutL [Deltaproteobacteria bacterium]|nr:ethanolamine utilization microcompartment protein EutL [Deltaproteobacteria bacterium]
MKLDLRPIKPDVLAMRVIPRVEDQLAGELGLKLQPGKRSLGLLTCTSDDALYVALDEGTKAAPVEVAYARSFYAGASHSSGPLSGEVIGIFVAEDLEEIQAALRAAKKCLEEDAWFYAADERGELAFFPHVVSSTGRYLSAQAGIEPGQPLAYLIAPPLESILGLDAALKAGETTLVRWFGPPSETNFGGGYLTGSLPDCEAAALAFAAAVVDVARSPKSLTRAARAAGEILGSRPSGPEGAGRYRVLATGERLGTKPDHLTHLVDDESLVPKTHPRIELRGKMDLLEGTILDAQVAAHAEGCRSLVGDLDEVLTLVRRMVGAEVTGRPLGPFALCGMDPERIRWASHHTHELYGVPFMYPSVRHGLPVAKLNLARAMSREAERALLVALPDRQDLLLAINRISSVLYVITCKYVAGRYDSARRPIGPVKGWRPPPKADLGGGA